MKIVILDGFTTNPGDMTWSLIEALGETTVYDRTSTEDIVLRAKDAEVVLTNDVPLTRQTLEQLPNLKYIGILATGYNIVDVKAAMERGICVCNVPNYSTHSVAQTTIALLLELCHRTGAHSEAVRRGEWSKSLDYCFWNYPLVELHGKTLGIIGYGRIGKAVGTVAKALGMKVQVYAHRSTEAFDEEGTPYCSLEELFKTSDVVSLHCPLTEKTKGLINRETLSWMRPTAFLINVSRGLIVVEEDLAEALNSGRLAGAGLDVLSTEPPKVDNPLLSAENCIIMPHIAWAPIESRQRLVKVAADNLQAYLAGSPQNVVS